MTLWLNSGDVYGTSATSAWVHERLEAMTLRQKIGQMIMVDLEGTGYTPADRRFFTKGSFGGVVFFEENLESSRQVRQFIRQLQTHAILRSGVPLLVSVDQEGGTVNRLGEILDIHAARHGARTLGAAIAYAPHKARPLVQKLTGKIARRMKALGFNMNLAPVLDTARTQGAFIYDRSFGGHPGFVTRVASDYIAAMHQAGLATTGKHFPNLSGTRLDSHVDLPVLDRPVGKLYRNEWVPFRRLNKTLPAIMVGHVVVPAVDADHPASLSPAAIHILRRRIGFDGVVVSDDLKMKAVNERYSLPHMLRQGLRAGLDIFLMAWEKQKQLKAVAVVETLVRSGRIPESRINRSVRRILHLKHRFAR